MLIVPVLAVLVLLGLPTNRPADGQEPVTPKAVDLLPWSTTVGHFVETDTPMPTAVDKSAKGGPAHSFTFTVTESKEIFFRLDCDTCPPHLALTGPRLKKPKVAKDRYTALIQMKLAVGTYTLWVSTLPTHGGAYTLLIDTESEPDSTLRVFSGVTASYQSRKETVTFPSVVRLGAETFAVTQGDNVYKSYKYADIVAVTSATSSSSDPLAAILFGPAFGTSSHQRYITVRTADDYVVLEMPVDSFQVLLAELERAARIKKDPSPAVDSR